MANPTTSDYKVLPFEGAQGVVPGHEIRAYLWDFMTAPAYKADAITHLVFETFDDVAQMPVEIVIHWTRWTEYIKRKWPGGGALKAVICQSGKRMAAEARHVRHASDGGYDAAPILCRDAFKVVTLGGGYPLLEVVGVADWIARGTPMACPWARDNAAFAARQGAAQPVEA